MCFKYNDSRKLRLRRYHLKNKILDTAKNNIENEKSWE